ncbi:MAG TPA: DNA mismatch repair protein MutS [Firmicutes bacterium]|nr:DNA mismatch repair protein MutS [Bacillota bacterium]
MEKITPMLKQYQRIKSQYKDCILFFRLGDFYEMFYDDAKKASSVLDIVLTSRDAGKSGKVPMCGIPYHAAESYISRLIKAGFKVAICEQVEDPSKAKGIVKREVVRVITSGTFIDETSAEPRYLLSFILEKGKCGIAFIDSSSGTIQTNEFEREERTIEIISKLNIYECIFPERQQEDLRRIFKHPLLKNKNITLTPFPDWSFNSEISKKSLCEHFGVHNLKGFGIEDKKLSICASGALLEYLKQLNKQPMLHIDKISIYSDIDFVFISPSACYGLEIDKLIKTIDNTLTPMGKRELKFWVYHPLKDVNKIRERQKAVKLLKENAEVREKLEEILKNIPDIEKSLSRISYGICGVKDLLAIRNTLLKIPQIEDTLRPLYKENQLFYIHDIPELRELLDKAINPEIPITNYEGKVIKKGYSKELDELREIEENGREWLRKFQEREIKRTGITSLKVGYNKVFGYYIEVSKPNLPLVPPDYIRKQTLVNAERFITEQLKEFEEKMVYAQENILKIEEEIINSLKEKILSYSSQIHTLASDIARIDVIYSLSVLATSPGYCLPEVNEGTGIYIKEGRHPVVENSLEEPFVPNDTKLDTEDNHLLIITGPNMSGKSTYIRQNAIIVIMAQIGSYIPAKEAKIGIVDKIFARIGAQDEISKGQSTFMVEMSETANILNNLSPRSLVILDEIGRGTSTFDGLSLAWAVGEYLQKKKVRTLFATHFHELTALAEKYHGVKNYNVAVKEWGNEIIFLHKITPGSTDKSYGIYVAKLAGIPENVIKRAEEILAEIEIRGNLKETVYKKEKDVQLTLFPEKETEEKIEELKRRIKMMERIIDEIKSIDINNITGLQALMKINEWKSEIKNGENKDIT